MDADVIYVNPIECAPYLVSLLRSYASVKKSRLKGSGPYSPIRSTC